MHICGYLLFICVVIAVLGQFDCLVVYWESPPDAT